MKHICLLQIVAATFLISFISCADSPTTAPLATRATVPASRIVGKHRVVLFPEVRNETMGIAAEHAWTNGQFPGYQWSSRQVFEDSRGRIYHRVLLVDRRGREVTVYFDVTNWFDQL